MLELKVAQILSKVPQKVATIYFSNKVMSANIWATKLSYKLLPRTFDNRLIWSHCSGMKNNFVALKNYSSRMFYETYQKNLVVS